MTDSGSDVRVRHLVAEAVPAAVFALITSFFSRAVLGEVLHRWFSGPRTFRAGDFYDVIYGFLFAFMFYGWLKLLQASTVKGRVVAAGIVVATLVLMLLQQTVFALRLF